MSLHDSLVNYAVITRWINSVKIFSSNSSLSLKSPAIGLARTVPRKDLTTPSRKRTNRAFSFICFETEYETRYESYFLLYSAPPCVTPISCSMAVHAYHRIIGNFLFYDNWTRRRDFSILWWLTHHHNRKRFLFYGDWRVRSCHKNAYHHIVEISCSMIIE